MFSQNASSPYIDGYKAGFKKGYCLEDFGCISPIPPIPGFPKLGFDSYEDGYANGLQDGKKRKESDTTGAYRNPPQLAINNSNNSSQAGQNNSNSFNENFDQSYNQASQIMEKMYANLDKKGSATYFPKAKTKRFKKLAVDITSGFGSLNIPLDYSGEEDPMYLGQKLAQALRGTNIIISPNSPYSVGWQYKYRPDTGCGGVVINLLKLSILDTRNNIKVGDVQFKQSGLEGKCTDDVVFQMTEKFITLNQNFEIGDYETYLNPPKPKPQPQESKKADPDYDFDDVYAELKKLKELLDLGVLSQEEFDERAKVLKSKILE